MTRAALPASRAPAHTTISSRLISLRRHDDLPLAHHHVHLAPHAGLAGQIHPRLDREPHARDQQPVVVRLGVVDRRPEAVQAVAVDRVAGAGDWCGPGSPASAMTRLAAASASAAAHRLAARAPARSIRSSAASRASRTTVHRRASRSDGAADRRHPGLVGVDPVGLLGPEVEQQQRARHDRRALLRGRLVVRPRGVGTPAHAGAALGHQARAVEALADPHRQLRAR